MKKRFIVIIAIVLFVLFVSVLGLFWWKGATDAPSSDSAKVKVIIEPGSSTEKIGKELASEGVIKNAFAFKLYSQFNDEVKAVPPGVFSVPRNLAMSEVVDLLMEGPDQIRVIIPEGKRREEVAELVADQLKLTGLEYDSFRQEFLLESGDMEGFLFPDTYDFFPDVTASSVVNRLRSTFDIKFDKESQRKAMAQGLDLSEVVTLASVIERETKTADPNERPTVAGIFLNRLELGMPLQADATAQYAIGSRDCKDTVGCDWWSKDITREDLTIDSPYNTYKYPGLPLAPIANPGLTSLVAVSNPIDSNYLYYIHDDDGKIHYAATLEEHNQNISTYLQ